MHDHSRGHALTAELLGTAFLLAAVVGSGIMGDRLSAGNAAIALLANSLATGAALVALILALGPISGAHFNPAVTLTAASQGAMPWATASRYVLVQVVGAVAGVLLAHAMFDVPLVSVSAHVRAGGAQILSEAVATFGLLFVVLAASKHRPDAAPVAVACYIVAAYWFTASTSFANPAVTLARSLTDTFAGIRPADVPGFLLGQLAGAGLAAAAGNWLFPTVRQICLRASSGHVCCDG